MWVLTSGAALGALGSLLAYLGNPPNSGICISCFLENTAGALGLHPNARMQYLRPELLGFLLGSAVMALATREFRPRWRGSGAALVGFGFLMILGSAVFIGCPIKALLRLAAGDLTAVPAFAGLGFGIWVGLKLLAQGGAGLEGLEAAARPGSPPRLVALGPVALAAALLALAFVPGALLESTGGGGSLHAPRAVSLGAGLLLGALCQRSRFCVTGSLRDLLLTRSLGPVAALSAALAAAATLNAFTGQFRLGYHDQPGTHLEWLWSGLGMALVGLAAVLAGGCPFRQIVKAGEGDLDAGLVGVGMVLGAALVQTWGLGATTSGVPAAGKVATLVGLAALLSFGLRKSEERG
ncbi:MAG: YedE-related selenium metabolism membrane protein [Deltaproteobacteria bacterium]|nr:YedE-related selenium metabolism membrane protein [Deltaproteobacteria bacterium]